jgi:PAS domain S-box-containing protein
MDNHLNKTNEEAFRAIYEACEEGIVAVDDNGKIKMANTAAHTIFGYEKNELQNYGVEDLIPQSLKKSHTKNRVKYNKNPEPRRMGAGRELLALKKDGQHFPVEISLNVATLNGKRHVIAYIIDISERKKIEAALKKSEEQLILYASQLEKRVKERTEELELANKELEKHITVTKKAEQEARVALERERELNELKSRFVSMASHEFRTPLSTILSSASLISKYNEPGTEDKRIKHVDKIKSSIGNLNNILNDFLSLAKLEEGKTELIKSEFNIAELIEEVIGEMEGVLKKDQNIQLEIIGDQLIINNEKKITTNILINLISNATKYSSEGKRINIILTTDNTEIKIEVKDYGMGIPEAEQKHLFERFFRAKNAINIQGTGLGLNIVKKYVDMLNGSISFESKINIGTTFKVILPL